MRIHRIKAATLPLQLPAGAVNEFAPRVRIQPMNGMIAVLRHGNSRVLATYKTARRAVDYARRAGYIVVG